MRILLGLMLAQLGGAALAQQPADEQTYNARLRASEAEAQAFQGPLDGGWTLSAGATQLYTLQFTETGDGALQGAWRDPRRAGGLGGSGFIDKAARKDGRLTLRFKPGRRADVTLELGPDGVWSGVLRQSGRRTAVRMTRLAPG
jgi:hypothetical protein